MISDSTWFEEFERHAWVRALQQGSQASALQKIERCFIE